jgi:hypothetical protein
VRIQILRDKPIRLIKRLMAGLKNLLVTPYLKRRIRRRAIRDYQTGEYQNSPYPFNGRVARGNFTPRPSRIRT